MSNIYEVAVTFTASTTVSIKANNPEHAAQLVDNKVDSILPEGSELHTCEVKSVMYVDASSNLELDL